jgi:hypothetical protein
LVRKAKELVKANGIISTPNREHGKMLKDDAVKLVPGFCDVDEIRRCMPGKHRTSVKERGKRLHRQK